MINDLVNCIALMRWFTGGKTSKNDEYLFNIEMRIFNSSQKSKNNILTQQRKVLKQIQMKHLFLSIFGSVGNVKFKHHKSGNDVIIIALQIEHNETHQIFRCSI